MERNEKPNIFYKNPKFSDKVPSSSERPNLIQDSDTKRFEHYSDSNANLPDIYGANESFQGPPFDYRQLVHQGDPSSYQPAIQEPHKLVKDSSRVRRNDHYNDRMLRESQERKKKHVATGSAGISQSGIYRKKFTRYRPNLEDSILPPSLMDKLVKDLNSKFSEIKSSNFKSQQVASVFSDLIVNDTHQLKPYGKDDPMYGLEASTMVSQVRMGRDRLSEHKPVTRHINSPRQLVSGNSRREVLPKVVYQKGITPKNLTPIYSHYGPGRSVRLPPEKKIEQIDYQNNKDDNTHPLNHNLSHLNYHQSHQYQASSSRHPLTSESKNKGSSSPTSPIKPALIYPTTAAYSNLDLKNLFQYSIGDLSQNLIKDGFPQPSQSSSSSQQAHNQNVPELTFGKTAETSSKHTANSSHSQMDDDVSVARKSQLSSNHSQQSTVSNRQPPNSAGHAPNAKYAKITNSRENNHFNPPLSGSSRNVPNSLPGPVSRPVKDRMGVYRKIGPNHDFTFQNHVKVKGVPYWIVKLIAKGGSSRVFSVIDANNNYYAFKEVKLEKEAAYAVELFLDEAEKLKKLEDSPHVVNLVCYEINYKLEMIFMIMELGDTSLDNWFDSAMLAEYDYFIIKSYWFQMLCAVRDVHEKNIVHTDLKPANFMIIKGKLKLIDFGIARQISHNHTSVIATHEVGTLEFMAPENLLRYKDYVKDVSNRPPLMIRPASDIWSLGCILYLLIYHRSPLQSLSRGDQIAFLRGNHPNFSIKLDENCCYIDPNQNKQIEFEVPQEALNLLRQCLDFNPDNRPTAQQLLDHPFLKKN